MIESAHDGDIELTSPCDSITGTNSLTALFRLERSRSGRLGAGGERSPKQTNPSTNQEAGYSVTIYHSQGEQRKERGIR